jgi:anaphase-promoting complex subunit 1
MLFPDDLRAEEVQKILNASRIVKISVAHAREAELLQRQQVALQLAFNRKLAISFGRGLVGLDSTRPHPQRKMEFHKLELQGRNTALMSTVTPDPLLFTADYFAWPEFHNGVATGLSISSEEIVDASWIIFNRPEEPNNEHAGFLLGLGLNGHLRKMARYLLFEYLNAKHDLSSIGLLLGLGATYFGSRNEMVAKLATLHVPACLPSQSSDMNVSSTLQSSALLCLGMLHVGSCQRRLTEIMLDEISRSQLNVCDANQVYRDSYSLSAGLALGLLTLGSGGNAPGLSDMQIADRLCLLMEGGEGEASDKHSNSKEGSSRANEIQAQRFYESHAINKDVTSAGAHVALGLMYLRSENQNIVARLPLPRSIAGLERFRPDIIMLRVIVRNLIMWSEIEVSREWILRQITQFIRTGLDGGPQILIQAYRSIISGCCFALALKYAGSHRPDVLDLIVEFLDSIMAMCSSNGTFSPYYYPFTQIPLLVNIASLDKKLTRAITMSCIDVLCIAGAIVAAGTGHAELLGRLRYLRSRTSTDVTFGNHLAYHMAMGILFMGGGRYSFKQDDRSISILLCALYPRFPSAVNDNRTHNQAFRHLWTLAVEDRCLETYYQDQLTPTDVTIVFECGKDGFEHHLTRRSPCLIPNDERIVRIIVSNGDRFQKIILSPKNAFKVNLREAQTTKQTDWRQQMALYRMHLNKRDLCERWTYYRDRALQLWSSSKLSLDEDLQKAVMKHSTMQKVDQDDDAKITERLQSYLHLQRAVPVRHVLQQCQALKEEHQMDHDEAVLTASRVLPEVPLAALKRLIHQK